MYKTTEDRIIMAIVGVSAFLIDWKMAAVAVLIVWAHNIEYH